MWGVSTNYIHMCVPLWNVCIGKGKPCSTCYMYQNTFDRNLLRRLGIAHDQMEAEAASTSPTSDYTNIYIYIISLQPTLYPSNTSQDLYFSMPKLELPLH